MKPPEPSIEPEAKPPSESDSYVISLSLPSVVLKIRLAGRIGTEEPPGTNAFNGLSSIIPPKYWSEFMNSSTLRPNSISYTPGFLMCPEADISFVPVERPMPILAYSAPVLFTIHGTAAIDSTLFTTVGLAQSPLTAGNGGLILGLPLLPSSDSISAVSSPQM